MIGIIGSMEDSQYNALAKMIVDLHSELRTQIDVLRQDMIRGFAAQDEIHKEILDTIVVPFQDFQAEMGDVKSVHGRRFNKIERHLGLT